MIMIHVYYVSHQKKCIHLRKRKHFSGSDTSELDSDNEKPILTLSLIYNCRYIEHLYNILLFIIGKERKCQHCIKGESSDDEQDPGPVLTQII